MGTVVGVIIASIDNFAFGGEVSPILILGMLLVATAVAGYFWGIRCAPAVMLIWIFVPALHLVNLGLGLPDTLHPRTYGSALKLAAFTAVVAVIGAAGGAAVGALAGPTKRR
ncbi:MAG: hypothetical protein WA825_14370 [Steroidobacteraceae bacterium]